MQDRSFDPARFFEHFSRFIETSETGRVLDRLNARYLALVHANRELIVGGTILDLASHDGRFSFAALKNGARRVIGIEHEPRLVAKSRANMVEHGVAREQYEFIDGDIFEEIDAIEPCDVVFCFGLLYHINHHMLLLSRIAEHDPRSVIIDTNISHLEPAVIEIRNPVSGSALRLGGQLEGYPSKAGLDAMMSSFGWSYDYFDWKGSGLAETSQMLDYRAGRRVTAIVDCNRQPVPADSRLRAVEEVFRRQKDLRSQWLTIRAVAAEIDTTPQALCTWVRKAERARARSRDRRD